MEYQDFHLTPHSISLPTEYSYITTVGQTDIQSLRY